MIISVREHLKSKISKKIEFDSKKTEGYLVWNKASSKSED
jgi:hypothetical protein